MLVLTRKVEEKIQIGPNVIITVLRIKGRSVQIGIEAPQGVLVLRGELAAAADLRGQPNAPAVERSQGHSSPQAPGAADQADGESQLIEHRRAPRRSSPPQAFCRSGAGDFVKEALSHC